MKLRKERQTKGNELSRGRSITCSFI